MRRKTERDRDGFRLMLLESFACRFSASQFSIVVPNTYVARDGDRSTRREGVSPVQFKVRLFWCYCHT